MGCRCAVEICRNTSSRTRHKDKSIRFYPFPKNIELLHQWINACHRVKDWIPDKSSYVCSEHFRVADFERDLKAELLDLPPKKILKPEAIPSRNLTSCRIKDENLQRQKIQEFINENKENSLIAPNDSFDGLVFSYLGVPKILLSSPESEISETNYKIQYISGQNEFVPIESNNNNPQTKLFIDQVDQDNDLTFIEAVDIAQNKNVFKLDELCRLCGSYSNCMKSIFDTAENDYCELIHKYFPTIKINKNDILPVLMCLRCENSLLSWFQFSKTCDAVNERFQSILKKLTLVDVDAEKSNQIPIRNGNTLKPSEIREKMDFDKNVDESELCSDSGIKEIEIVEVIPDVIESVYLDFMQSNETSELDDASEYLMEENINDSDVDNETADDMDEEMEDSSDIIESITDGKTASVLRKRRRRLASLNLKRMCHVCGKIFKYPESLRRHLKTVHSDEKPFKCHLCSSSFNRNHNRTIHIKVVHQRQRVYVKKNVPRLCDYCGKVLLSVRSLEEHISSIHTKKALYECDRCHTAFYRKLMFDKHKTSNECDGQNLRTLKSEEFLKYCEFCGLEFKKEHFYIKHMFKHMTSFTCPICSLKFEDGTVLKDHIDSDHPELKPFECEVCHKKFKSKSLLNCHFVIHSGEKRYECETCSLKFLKKKYLATHILTHTGERPFVCSICLKGFKQSGDMRKHKATHMRGRRLGLLT